MVKYAWLIPVFPLVGFIINGLFGCKYIKKKAHLIAVPALGLSWLLSILVFLDVLRGNTATLDFFDWIVSGSIHVRVAFMVDQLSAVMLMVVTTLSFWIHVYSIGYMGHDPGYPRFFTYLNMFVFFMLILVLGSSYALMFVGWEGVGLCSYLLIGFWYERDTASDAGKKAFITNRIGDAGFIMGMFTLWYYLGSLDYKVVFAKAHLLSPEVVTIATLLLFVGATGKSAQIPLYVWLPDAMEGPTPVSALIHAATMVTAGVYMVARSNVLFNMAPLSMEVVAIVGCLTAFMAATIGTSQYDLKRVLAYSTVSQLGYMFLGCGVGAYAAGIFHLMTHAFFKGLLFLAAGSVMHAMMDVLDIRIMGNLRKKMVATAGTFIVGALALSGIPPFAGFWSKDEILAHTFYTGHYFLWFLGTFTAFLTAYYTFRAVFMTFFGKERIPHEISHHLHESPKVMTIPLIFLAIGAATVGFFGLKNVEHKPYFVAFLEPVIQERHPGHVHETQLKAQAVVQGVHGAQKTVEAEKAPSAHAAEVSREAAHEHEKEFPEIVLVLISVVAGLLGILLAYLTFLKRVFDPSVLIRRTWLLHKILYNKYWVDEVYGALIIWRVVDLAYYSWKFDQWIIDGAVNAASWIAKTSAWVTRVCVEPFIVDGAVNGAAELVRTGYRVFRRIQTGLVENYMLYMALGLFLMVTVYIFINIL
jgi:NADH-quinone oxidoreductase subunit L